MAYVRVHETKQRSRGKPIRTYAVVYRAKERTDDGRIVTRLRQETHATRAAAEARVAELRAHRHHHTTDPAEQRRRGQRSLAEWSTDWLASQRVKVVAGQLKQRTLDEYARLLDCYVMPELGHVPIAAVTPAQLEHLIAGLATDRNRRGGGDLHPKTIKHAWHVTRQVFRYALRHDAITANPVDRVDFSANRATGDHDGFEPHPLAPEQIADLCAALRGQRPGPDGNPLPSLPVYALMVEFAAYTGLRASELAGLEVADLTFAPVPAGTSTKCSVRVERTKFKGKRAGEGWIVGTPKSKRSRRTVPLPGWLAAKMADYLLHDHPRAGESDAPLWPARTGQAARVGRTADEWQTALNWSEPVELGTFYRYAFAHALAAVGLPVTTPASMERQRRDGTIEPARPGIQGVRLHDLRHSAAVAWLQAGVPVVQLSRWLGHAQPTITLNVYGDWVPETVENPLPEPTPRSVVVPLRGHVP
jgi:integrase